MDEKWVVIRELGRGRRICVSVPRSRQTEAANDMETLARKRRTRRGLSLRKCLVEIRA